VGIVLDVLQVTPWRHRLDQLAKFIIKPAKIGPTHLDRNAQKKFATEDGWPVTSDECHAPSSRF
jgi:hypothetical protein